MPLAAKRRALRQRKMVGLAECQQQPLAAKRRALRQRKMVGLAECQQQPKSSKGLGFPLLKWVCTFINIYLLPWQGNLFQT